MRRCDTSGMCSPHGGCQPAPSAKETLENLTQKDWEMIALKATVAQQAQMIEHLRGGPTPGYTAVDMANAAADGRRSFAEHLIERLAEAYPNSESTMTVECLADWLSEEIIK